jgi:hypothetical protein
MPAIANLISGAVSVAMKRRLAQSRRSRYVHKDTTISALLKATLQILQNEQQTWTDLVKYVHDNDVDCDLWVGDTLDVPITPEVAEAANVNFERFKAAGGKVDHIKVTSEPVEAEKVLESIKLQCTAADVEVDLTY